MKRGAYYWKGIEKGLNQLKTANTKAPWAYYWKDICARDLVRAYYQNFTICPFKFYLHCKSFHWLSGKSWSSCYYIAYVVGGGGWLPWCLHPFGYYPTSHPLFTSCKLPAPINPLFPSLTPDHLHNVEGIIREGKARPNRRR